MRAERILPRALPADGCLGIVSPAGSPAVEKVERGIARLHELGYRTKLFPSALKRGPIYYAGTVEERLADLHAAFAEDEVDAVLCTRGGWGSAELLPFLDAKLIRAAAKPFIGYSDQTSIHAWLDRACGLASFYAPMVAADFSRLGRVEHAVNLRSWQNALSSIGPWTLDASDGMRILKTGEANGTLFGGCISIVAQSLGTPYAMLPRKDALLFVEDVGLHPYQWDRMLLHLRYSGLMERVRGIVFGDMEQCVPPAESFMLEAALMHNLRDFKGPVVMGLRCGHVHGANISLPLGVKVSLQAHGGSPGLTITEAAVK